jgi:hypothetical protein
MLLPEGGRGLGRNRQVVALFNGKHAAFKADFEGRIAKVSARDLELRGL